MSVFKFEYEVTILILIDGFLQFGNDKIGDDTLICHNPYFNRWFSAIRGSDGRKNGNKQGHNPYFNRWFSAI